MTQEEAILNRDIALKLRVDCINAVRWHTMTDSEKTEWVNYRQALLDLPDQEGFPDTIEWPWWPVSPDETFSTISYDQINSR